MFEMTTSAGAAIVRHYVKERVLIPQLEVEWIGYCFGTYKTKKPDVLRLLIGVTEDPL